MVCQVFGEVVRLTWLFMVFTLILTQFNDTVVSFLLLE